MVVTFGISGLYVLVNFGRKKPQIVWKGDKLQMDLLAYLVSHLVVDTSFSTHVVFHLRLNNVCQVE